MTPKPQLSKIRKYSLYSKWLSVQLKKGKDSMTMGITEKILKDNSSQPSNNFCPHLAPDKILGGLKKDA